ncbi:MAG: 30S ribosomal protein S3 [bacterium]
MGQKIHPIGFRIGITEDWKDKWYAQGDEYAANVLESKKLRDEIFNQYPHALISDIVIKRFGNKIKIDISAARTGIIIGRGGSNIKQLRQDLVELVDNTEFEINIEEVSSPETDATLVAQGIAEKLENRVHHRRAMKEAMQNAIRRGALGIKVQVAGRLNGVDIARREWYREGRIPLHTLRAKIDYSLAEAYTKFGIIGVKAWIFKGEEL